MEAECSPLHTAAVHNDTEIMADLLGGKGGREVYVNSRHESDRQTPLMLAAAAGHCEAVELLVSHAADLNARRRSDMATALILASAGGYADVVRVLLAQPSVDVVARTSDGRTALLEAVCAGHKDVVDSILGHPDADVGTRSNDGSTPLHLAVFYGRNSMVHRLLSCGASVAARTFRGATPLHLAVRAGRTDMLEWMLDAGGDQVSVGLRMRTRATGATCLHLAAAVGSVAMARILFACGASVTARNKQGLFPIHVAAVKGHLDVVSEILLPAHRLLAPSEREETPTAATLDAPREQQWALATHARVSPLHLAAAAGQAEMVAYLCTEAGLSPAWATVDGDDALAYAGPNADPAVLRHLNAALARPSPSGK